MVRNVILSQTTILSVQLTGTKSDLGWVRKIPDSRRRNVQKKNGREVN